MEIVGDWEVRVSVDTKNARIYCLKLFHRPTEKVWLCEVEVDRFRKVERESAEFWAHLIGDKFIRDSELANVGDKVSNAPAFAKACLMLVEQLLILASS